MPGSPGACLNMWLGLLCSSRATRRRRRPFRPRSLVCVRVPAASPSAPAAHYWGAPPPAGLTCEHHSGRWQRSDHGDGSAPQLACTHPMPPPGGAGGGRGQPMTCRPGPSHNPIIIALVTTQPYRHRNRQHTLVHAYQHLSPPTRRPIATPAHHGRPSLLRGRSYRMLELCSGIGAGGLLHS